ncbi:histidine kinase [Sphingobacteriaceae bacterium]|nr:histidine kinase [Sphingobacteriaceae bacterium]
MKKSSIYWYCQIFGWSFYIIVNSVFFGLSYQSSFKEYLIYFLMLPIGIAISHFYRNFIIRQKILELRISLQLICIVLFSLVKAVIFFLIFSTLFVLFGLLDSWPDFLSISTSITDFTVVFSLWNIIYFGFQYFQNYKRAEINSLRYLAASRESELNSLKAQLNPHFIFNCMNSIRALIDENPTNAKTAVTQLSNILRNTLLMDKSKEIFLKDEIALVKDYLNLEQIRYEERLNYTFKIEENISSAFIPPFIIQSQVENAIKHGISRLPGGGQILIEAFKEEQKLKIQVSNSGKINSETPLTGVGFKNSILRLELLYGSAGKISIHEANDLVVVEITIPLK